MPPPNSSFLRPSASIEYGDESLAHRLLDLGALDGDGQDETLLRISNYGKISSSFAGVWTGDLVTFGSSPTLNEARLGALSVQAQSVFGYRAVLSGDFDGTAAPTSCSVVLALPLQQNQAQP